MSVFRGNSDANKWITWLSLTTGRQMERSEQMTDGVKWSGVILFVYVLLWLIRSYAKDLLFYRRNGWNFTEDSGEKLYHGEYPTPETLTTNKYRVLIGMPMMILIFAIVILAVIFLPPEGLEFEFP
jgi:hypothetical protein